MRNVVMTSKVKLIQKVHRPQIKEEDCKCGGRGVYVITPEEFGYHRAESLDRLARPESKKVFLATGEVANVLPLRRVSTAYVNDRGTTHHFAADDPGGFGVRCEVHGKLYETTGEINGSSRQAALVQEPQDGAGSSDPGVQPASAG